MRERKTGISLLLSHLVREVIKLPRKNTIGGVSVISKSPPPSIHLGIQISVLAKWCLKDEEKNQIKRCYLVVEYKGKVWCEGAGVPL